MPTSTKKPIKVIPGTVKTIPKITPATIIPKKTLEDQLEEIYDEIDIDVDDLPDELLEVYEELEGTYKEKSIQKNWKLWLSMFTPFILPAFIKGVSGQVTLPYDARQSVQSNAPEPKVVVDYAKKYFESRGLELVKTLSKTDCERLKVQLKDNWGKGPDAFKKSFQEDYANTKARLDSIYRTEYVTAQNEGILARSRDAGHKMKQWNAALDERTCPVCGDQLHGTIIPIEEQFSFVLESKNGSEEVVKNAPPAHVNCRCVLTTLDEEDYDEIKEDSAYLDNVTDFIKLNYKCEFNGTDNKCGLENSTTSLTDRYDDKNTDSNVIAGYVRNDNKLVNSILSGDYDLSEKDKNRGLEKIRLLDNIFKDKLLPKKEITYRGISESNIKNLPDNWNKVGNAISPGTFLSTSRSRSEAEGFITGGPNDDSILIKLILPKNTNAINVSDFVPKTSAYAYSFDENEVLVDRNIEFKVVDYRIENSRNMGELHIATWEAIPNEQKENSAYISDAFETIKLNYKCKAGTVDDSNKCAEESKTENKLASNATITKVHRDVPNISWLQNDREYAKERAAKTGRPITGTVTASFEGRLPIEIVKDLPGENNEHTNKDILTDFKAEPIFESIKNEGVKEPITIFVNYEGKAYISEGNHRTHIAYATGQKDIPVEVRYFSGGEFIKGTWNLRNFEKETPEKYIEFENAINNEPKNVPEKEEPTKGNYVRPTDKDVRLRYLKTKYLKKQDSSYLADAFETIKLNYKCKAGTVDDSNKCNTENNSSESKNSSTITLPGLPDDMKLDKNSFGQIHEAIQRNVFNLNVTKIDENNYFLNVSPKNIPENWITHNDDNDRNINKHFDPEFFEIKPLFEGSKITKMARKKDFVDSLEGKEEGHLFRGMSYDEYENIQKSGYIQSKGGYNFDFQEGLTYFSLDKGQASYYASGFAPWQYAPTPDKPAVMVTIKEPSKDRQETDLASGADEVGVRGKVPSSDIVDVYFGYPVAFEDGYLEIRKENGIAVNGSSIQYNPKIRWEKQQKQDSSYLEDVANFIKLNYNCPDSEKNGSGPGSCGGSKPDAKKETLEEYGKRYFKEQKKLDLETDQEYSKIKNSIINKCESIEKGSIGFTSIDNGLQILKKSDNEYVLYSEYGRDYSKGFPGNPSSMQEIKETIDRVMFHRIKAKLEKSDKIAYAKEHTRPSNALPPNSEEEKLLLDNSIQLIENQLESVDTDLFKYFSRSFDVTSMLVQNPKYKFTWKDPMDINSNEKENVIATMDKLISQSTINSPITTYSGISKEYYDKIIKNPNKPFKSITFMSTSRDESIAEGFAEESRKMANNKYLNVQGKKMKPVGDEKYVAEVHLVPGSKAISLEKYYDKHYPYLVFDYAGENRPIAESREIVVNRGTKYKVIGTKKSGNINKVILESVVD